MQLGEKIRAYRHAAGLSQEQLAAQVGVSAQAVSKWETASALPDTALLPAIADALSVSLDALFGRCPAGERDLIRAMYRSFAGRENVVFSDIWEMLYHAQMLYWSGFSEEPPAMPERNTRCQYFGRDGFCHGVYGDDRAVLVAAPVPEGGWQGLMEDDAQVAAMLAALGDEETRRAVRRLYRRSAGYSFLFPVLMRDAGISPEAEARVCENLLTMRLISCRTVVIDGEAQQTYTFTPRLQFPAIWLLLTDFAHNDTWFNFQSSRHDGPLFGA